MVLKRAAAGRAAVRRRPGGDSPGGQSPGGLIARHLPRAAPYVPDTAARGGHGAEALQVQAGHRSIETTRLYLHLSNDWLADEYQRGLPSSTPRWPRRWPMSAAAFRSSPEPTPPDRWAALQVEAPKLSGTARRYLAQIEVSMSRPRWKRPMKCWPVFVPIWWPAPRCQQLRRCGPSSHRGLQGPPRSPGHSLGHAAKAEHPQGAPDDGASVLRPGHRMGLPRMPPPSRLCSGPTCPKPPSHFPRLWTMRHRRALGGRGPGHRPLPPTVPGDPGPHGHARVASCAP